MKINKLALSVAAGLALAAASASAVTAGLNDIVVAFTNGANPNIEVNVGKLTINDTAPGSYALGNISSYLTTAYTSGWASDAALGFGAVGWAGNTTSNLFATGAWTTNTGTLGVQNSLDPYQQQTSASGLNIIGGKITTFDNAMGNAAATILASNAVSLPTGTTGSFDKSLAGSAAFGGFDASVLVQNISNGNGTFVASDLYRIAPNTDASDPVYRSSPRT